MHATEHLKKTRKVILRCFFCKNRVELMLEGKPANITCPSCGKNDRIIWGHMKALPNKYVDQ
jgi:hypothetical protein